MVCLFVVFVSPLPVPSVGKTDDGLGGPEVEHQTDCSEGGVELSSNTSSDVETPCGASATMLGGPDSPVGCGFVGGWAHTPPTGATPTSVGVRVCRPPDRAVDRTARRAALAALRAARFSSALSSSSAILLSSVCNSSARACLCMPSKALSIWSR